MPIAATQPRPSHAAPAQVPRCADDLPGVILLCKALRVWSAAQAAWDVAPREALTRLLGPRGLGGLAPAYDALFSAATALAGRPLATGCGCTISPDEAWLADRLGLQR